MHGATIKIIYIYIHKVLICTFLYLQVSLKTWNRRRKLLSIIQLCVHCWLLFICNSKQFVYLHLQYIFSPHNIQMQYMIFKNTSRLYYCCCLHYPVTCLNGKNIFFFLILRARHQLGVPRVLLSLKKLNFAHSLRFV